MAQLEKEIENNILEYLTLKGVFCWKNQSVGIWDQTRKVYRKSRNRFHLNGVSDVLGILPGGRMLCVEVKSKLGRLSDNQKTFLAKTENSGGLALVARSIEDLDPVFDYIREYQEKRL